MVELEACMAAAAAKRDSSVRAEASNIVFRNELIVSLNFLYGALWHLSAFFVLDIVKKEAPLCDLSWSE